MVVFMRFHHGTNETSVIVKRNSDRLEEFSKTSRKTGKNVEAKTEEGIKVEEKIEEDVYPCRRKFARSVKVQNVTVAMFEKKMDLTVADLPFKHLDTIVGENEKLVVVKNTTRLIAKVDALITVRKSKKRLEKVPTKFVLEATYPTVSEEVMGEVTPEVVELSFRIRAKNVRRRKLGERIIQAASEIHKSIANWTYAIENKC